MSKATFIDTLTQISEYATEHGVIYLNTQDKKLVDNYILIDNIKTVNFGSCSYLGLEFDERIKQGAIEAIKSFGTQFSCSRAYISIGGYEELERNLEEIFGSPTISSPTTTLGHIAAIPILVSPEDVVILDHQVHSSVQTAVALTKANRTRVELLRHNRMDLLENRIIELRGKYKKIWYMADGIYSMFGDAAPLEEIEVLLNKYPELHFYVDDAHGMSAFGKHGRGYVLSKINMHERMVIATSFAKGFGTGGGALIFSDRKTANMVRDCGGPLRASGPMQPSAIGAALASSKIHLSDDIYEYQGNLQQNIKYTTLLLKKYNLPNIAASFSPIFFIAVSLPKIAYKLINRLKKDGFFLNLGIFPAVPIKNTGVRFTITSLHTFQQIEDMVKSMTTHFNTILLEENFALDQIYKSFRMPMPAETELDTKVKSIINHSYLKRETYGSITEINSNEWDHIFQNPSPIDSNSLATLEKSFSNNDVKNDNWKFNYLIVRDFSNKIVLATFLTTSISKDDMFAERAISREIELKRQKDPFFMTTKTLSVGSPITEGNHIFIDRESEYWKEAVEILFERISVIQEQENIGSTIIRDLPVNDDEMDNLMLNNSYFKYKLPDNLKVKNMSWNTHEEYYQQLNKKNRVHYRKNVSEFQNLFNLSIVKAPSEKELEVFYKLYLNVKEKSLDLNTYTLPFKLFKNFALNEDWEFMKISLKANGKDITKETIVGMVICHKGKNEYSAVIAGIDYNVDKKYNVYRQMIVLIIKRGRQIGYENIALGYTSTIEKKHFGAKVVNYCAYMQVKDNYSMQALEMITTTKKQKNGIDKRRVLPI